MPFLPHQQLGLIDEDALRRWNEIVISLGAGAKPSTEVISRLEQEVAKLFQQDPEQLDYSDFILLFAISRQILAVREDIVGELPPDLAPIIERAQNRIPDILEILETLEKIKSKTKYSSIFSVSSGALAILSLAFLMTSAGEWGGNKLSSEDYLEGAATGFGLAFLGFLVSCCFSTGLLYQKMARLRNKIFTVEPNLNGEIRQTPSVVLSVDQDQKARSVSLNVVITQLPPVEFSVDQKAQLAVAEHRCNDQCAICLVETDAKDNDNTAYTRIVKGSSIAYSGPYHKNCLMQHAVVNNASDGDQKRFLKDPKTNIKGLSLLIRAVHDESYVELTPRGTQFKLFYIPAQRREQAGQSSVRIAVLPEVEGDGEGTDSMRTSLLNKKRRASF